MIHRYKLSCKILTLFLVFVSCKAVYAQDSLPKPSSQSVSIQVGGPAGLGSVNYERIILRGKSAGITIRAGISSNHLRDFENKVNPDIILPILLNGFLGERHKLELGIGPAFSSVVSYHSSIHQKSRKTQFSTVFQAGYRFQPRISRFYMGIYYSPIYEYNARFRHWGALSVGYNL